MIGVKIKLGGVEFSVSDVVELAGAVGRIVARDRGWKPGHSHNEAKGWIARINGEFDGTFKIYARAKKPPRIDVKGQHVLSHEDQEIAKKKLVELQVGGYTNENHAIVVGGPRWQDTPVDIEAEYLDYASVLALRDKDRKPPILSTSMVLLCSETRELILQRRSEKVHTYPNKLHTFGGGYWPPVPDAMARDDQYDLKATGVREVFEETSINVQDKSEEPEMIFSVEPETGFIQLVLLGIDISPASKGFVKKSWEGKLVYVHFDELEGKLRDIEDWCPSGRGHVLSWLALGAPCGIKKPTFAGLSAIDLFDRLMK